ncbi:MAG: carboxypeptidase-like regulatory domain-containing protein, partial [Terracidiphilus sp.]
MNPLRLPALWPVLLLCGLIPHALPAQTASPSASTGSLAGFLRDPSGALVAGSVTVTNSAARLERTVATDRAGHFLLEALPAGLYELRASAPGFDTATLAGVRVRAGHQTTLEIPLKVARVQTRIEVTEAPEGARPIDAAEQA